MPAVRRLILAGGIWVAAVAVGGVSAAASTARHDGFGPSAPPARPPRNLFDASRCPVRSGQGSRPAGRAGGADRASGDDAAAAVSLLRLQGGAKDKDMHKWVMKQATTQVRRSGNGWIGALFVACFAAVVYAHRPLGAH
jgi:hypothetical protein